MTASASGCSGCRHDEAQAKPAPEQLPPLSSPSPTTTLAVPGFGEAVTVVPVGATRPAPVVVAVIGIGDTPEEQCAAWRDIVGPRAFVVCPRGVPNFVRPETPEQPEAGSPDEPPPDEQQAAAEGEEPPPPQDVQPRQVGFYEPDAGRLEKEIDAALAALEKKWGPHVASRDVLYAGFSRGAFLGAQLAPKRVDRFKRVVLVEGGHSPWTTETAALFAKGGGARVLFACGRQECVDDALGAAAVLAKQKVETKTVFGEGEGHDYKKQVKAELRRSLDWVTEGDPLWQTPFAGAQRSD